MLDSLLGKIGAAPIVLAIGRLSPEKAYADLVRAFTSIAAGDSEPHLVIAGEGPERGALERLIGELGLRTRIHLPGYFERIDLLLARAACLAQPSLTEGLPITLLEAMAAQVPIIASRVGGIPAVLDNGAAGYIIAPGDVPGLAAALEATLGDAPGTRQRVDAARQLFTANYSATQMADRYQGIYLDCVGQSAPIESPGTQTTNQNTP
jgi:glycosyltransferase involved in cell wall biosynthesis